MPGMRRIANTPARPFWIAVTHRGETVDAEDTDDMIRSGFPETTKAGSSKQ